MKPVLTILLAALALAPALVAAPSLVPLPAKLAWGAENEAFAVDAGTTILWNGDAARAEAETLAEMLRPATGSPFAVREYKGDAKDAPANAILLVASTGTETGAEAYTLAVTTRGVVITGAPAGLFYGGQTLRQLLPAAIYAKTPQAGAKWAIPACTIADAPRFPFRAYMPDYSRHFLDVAYTKRTLDRMAMHKMNVLHMHLTDNEGWRLEIKKYPKLTDIGAWRGADCALPASKPPRDPEGTKRYGGFFTREDIRDIVAYAKRLHIGVMPEIDLPGHSRALCLAYPEMLAAGSPAGANAISPTREANFAMIDDIIAEVVEMFPYPYIHIGGDEVNHGLWANDPEVKEIAAREKRSPMAYFVKRYEQICAKHGRRAVVWGEAFNKDLAKTTAIMPWLGEGPAYAAARAGHPAIISGQYLYFGLGYPGPDQPPAGGWAPALDCKRIYSFDPVPARQKLSPEESARILGVDSCLWTEKTYPWKSEAGWLEIKTIEESADFRVFPRLCTVAEVAWTPQSRRDFTDYSARLFDNYDRLDAAGVSVFRIAPPDGEMRGDTIVILPPSPKATVRYTTDGSDPLNSPSAKTWKGESITARPADFNARTEWHGKFSPLRKGAGPEPMPGLKPAVVVTANFKTPKRGLAALADYRDATTFRAAEKLRKGDAITFTFEGSVALDSLVVTTGDNRGAHRVASAILEISENGSTFRKVADFTDGKASVKLAHESAIALRITATGDSDAGVIFHDPDMR